MEDKESILKSIPDAIKVDLTLSIQKHGRYATGRTTDALESVATDHTAQLLAPAHIVTLELGRKPTRPDAPKGDPTLQEVIAEWCKIRGIDEKASFPIARHIHLHGFPGKPGVLSEPLSADNVNKRVDEALDKLATIVTVDFLNLLNI